MTWVNINERYPTKGRVIPVRLTDGKIIDAIYQHNEWFFKREGSDKFGSDLNLSSKIVDWLDNE